MSLLESTPQRLRRPDTAARNRAMAHDPKRVAGIKRSWTDDRKARHRELWARMKADAEFEAKRHAALVKAMRTEAQRQRWAMLRAGDEFEAKRYASMAAAMGTEKNRRRCRDRLLFDPEGLAAMCAASARARTRITIETTLGPQSLRRHQARLFFQWRYAVGDAAALLIVTGKKQPPGFQWFGPELQRQNARL